MQFIRSIFSRKWLGSLLTLLSCLSTAVSEVILDSAQMLTYLGDPFSIRVDEPYDDGFTSYRYQWLKDGRIIPGQTERSLEIQRAKPQDAGHYQARIFYSDGAVEISKKMPLVVTEGYEAKEVYITKYSMILQPRFWGPVDRVYWAAGYDSPLKDCWWMRGTQTPRLRILSCKMIPDGVSCMAMVGEEKFVIRSFQFLYDTRVAPFEQSIFHSAPWNIQATVGSRIEEGYVSKDPGRLEVSGLPPGVTFSDGFLSGAPTKAGNYHLRWKLLNAKGQVTDTSRSWIFVKDLKKPALRIIPGLWAGVVESGTLAEAPIKSISKGVIQFDVSALGAFSGSLRLGLHRWPLAGALQWDGTLYKSRVVLTPPTGVKRLACIIYATPDGQDLFVSFEIEFTHPDKLGEGAAYWELSVNLQSPCTPDSADVLRPPGIGRITALLTGVEEDGHALGHGYMSMIPTAGLKRMNVFGTLPDGTGFTGSMPVVSGQPFSVIFYSPLGKFGQNLSGELALVGLPWGLVEQPLLQSGLYWERKPVLGKGWLAGKHEKVIWLDVQGELYFHPDSGPLLPSAEPGTETFFRLGGGTAFADFISSEYIPFDLKPNHRAVFPKADPRSFKLDIYPPTGFFTGSFNLLDVDGGGAQKVRFKGMMAPGLSLGAGYFHFKAPISMGGEPSAIYSGTVDVFRRDQEFYE